MIRYFCFLLFPLLLVLNSTAQIIGKLTLSNSTFASTTNELPFWLWANNDGKIAKNNSFLNLSEIGASGIYVFNDSRLYITAGTTLLAGIANESYFQPNQLFTKLNLNHWELSAGLYQDELMFGGLSSSNGNLAKSRNARPYPRIGFRISDYKPVPFIGKRLSFKGEYDEGLLTDERWVDKTHLHHKSFYLKYSPTTNFNVQAGFENFVMWGGTSRNEKIGPLPADLNAYWKYIKGAKGDERFPAGDQMYVAGNSFGTYQILLTQKFEKVEASLNISHPYEDYSGINWSNWPDNLIGFHLKFIEQNSFISELLYEFTNTRQQGISDSLYQWYRAHHDNYFNHGTYRSGVTNYGQTMVSPLFLPVKIEEGISTGIESTRFFSHHFGAKGNVGHTVAWKGMLTYVEHLGTYSKPYIHNKKYVFGLIEALYYDERLPFTLGILFAADVSNAVSNKAGFQVKLSKEW